MKNIDCHTISAVFQEVGHALCGAVRLAARTLRRMSWPALLLSCVALSLLLTILPLALTLFAVFLLFKLLVAAVFVHRHQRQQQENRHGGHAP
jgi:membrane protein implicated in regulation of membrane protease activity